MSILECAPEPSSSDLLEMHSTVRRHDTRTVLIFATVVHVAMYVYDAATRFSTFLGGDRSAVRWSSLEFVRDSGFSQILSSLTTAPTAPGEFLLTLPFAVAASANGVVAFQIVLFLLSLACLCKLAATFPWRYSVLAIGIVYTLLPHNLVFTHQFVTEAVATPFIVFFIYFFWQFADTQRTRDAIFCGLALGIAIFVRPPLMLVVPLLFVVRYLYGRYFSDIDWRRMLMICGIAILPLIAWTTAFTVQTGRVGFTAGVANLGWNLRSKVYLVHARNNLEQPPFLKGYANYPALYNDSGGISVATFAGYVAERPLLYAQAAISDAIIFLGRGDISKVFVDYFGRSDALVFKHWRWWVSQASPSEISGFFKNDPAALLLILAELSLSVLTFALSGAAIIFACYCFLRPNRVAEAFDNKSVAFILTLSSVLIAVFAGAQLVDQAQGRLRHPAEACILLLLAFGAWYLSVRRRHKLSQPAATAAG